MNDLPTGTRLSLYGLTKAKLLLVLESVPQGYWPPRPTRQDKKILGRAVYQAALKHPGVREAIAQIAARN